MRVVVATDEDTPAVEALIAHLEENGHEVGRLAEGEQWPEVGRAVAESVTREEADFGVVCCWTGTGVSIAANKVHGARAALCGDAQTAAGARKWNDANVLALSLRTTTPALAIEIVDAWLGAEPDAGEAPAIARLEP